MTSKQDAVKWLEREIWYLKGAPKLNGCAMTPEWREQLDIFTMCLKLLKKDMRNERNQVQG